MQEPEFKLIIKGKAIVLIDWANIRNQQEKLGWEVDLNLLYKWISSHEEVEKIQFFYGHRNTEKSREFLEKVASFGYEVITKEVKYMDLVLDNSSFKKKAKEIQEFVENLPDKIVDKELKNNLEHSLRKIMQSSVKIPKCDLDAEIVTEIMKNFAGFQTIILFSGDGDFAYTIKECLNNDKWVYIVSNYYSLGREIIEFKKQDPELYPRIINLKNLTFLST